MSRTPHPVDAPICETLPDGGRYWHLQDELHREDGPALEESDGHRAWFLRGERHREGGPAIEWPDGSREWWVRGKRHREDGAAVEYADGWREWWVHDQRHREDGPAVERADGSRMWWTGGRQFSWSLPAALFVVREAREELAVIADPATQRAAALTWASRLPPEVWQQVCAEALADPHDAELRVWGLRALGSRTLVSAEPSAPSAGASSTDLPSSRPRR